MKFRQYFLSTVAFSITVVASSATAQDERLSLEWVFSEEGKTAASLPDHAWLDSGLLMLYDKRVTMPERTIESYNPANGRRRSIVNAKKVIEAFTVQFEPEEPIEELGWPASFDPTGRWAVYEKSDDIVLLDLRSNELIRLLLLTPRKNPHDSLRTAAGLRSSGITISTHGTSTNRWRNA